MIRSTSNRLDILAALKFNSSARNSLEAERLVYHYSGTPDAQRQTQEVLAVYQEKSDQSHKVVIMDKSSPSCQTIQPPRKGEKDVCALVKGQALQSMYDWA